MKKIILLSLIIPIIFLSGCLDEVIIKEPSNRDFNALIGGILLSNDTVDIDHFSSMIFSIIQGNKTEYHKNFDLLSKNIEMKKVSDVVITGKRSDALPYRGIFIDSVREMRWTLAHVDQVKAVGIETLMIDFQLDAYKENGSLYIPGEETYLFYLNAFHQSGFRIWLALATTSYDFPYMWWSDEERIGIPSLENQEDFLDMVEPIIYRTAEISETYNVDTFVPGDEINNFIMDKSYSNTNLCEPERQKMDVWLQKILPQIKKRFSGKVGLATNDGGPCEDQKREGPKRDAPLFNYTGYDFIIQKIPFPSIFNFPNWSWEQGIESFLNNTLPLIDTYQMRGLLFYETGDTVGKALSEDFAGSRPVRESTPEDQKKSYEGDFWAMNKSDKILGMFFKIAGPQPNEPDWNPFGRPAEQTLIENFGKYQVLNLTETDMLWITIGEEGLKVIQICLSEKMPFDPDYSLEQTHDDYEKLISKVNDICRND